MEIYYNMNNYKTLTITIVFKVFTPECTQMYLRIFNFLWRAKRMEYILTATWKTQMSYSRLLKSLPG